MKVNLHFEYPMKRNNSMHLNLLPGKCSDGQDFHSVDHLGITMGFAHGRDGGHLPAECFHLAS